MTLAKIAEEIRKANGGGFTLDVGPVEGIFWPRALAHEKAYNVVARRGKLCWVMWVTSQRTSIKAIKRSVEKARLNAIVFQAQHPDGLRCGRVLCDCNYCPEMNERAA